MSSFKKFAAKSPGNLLGKVRWEGPKFNVFFVPRKLPHHFMGKNPQRFPPTFLCAGTDTTSECLGRTSGGPMEVGYQVIQVLPTVDGSEIRRSPPGMVLKPCK